MEALAHLAAAAPLTPQEVADNAKAANAAIGAGFAYGLAAIGPGGVDDLVGLGLDGRHLRLVVGHLGARRGACCFGPGVIVLDALVPGIHAALQLREQHPSHQHGEDDERPGPPGKFLDLGNDRTRILADGAGVRLSALGLGGGRRRGDVPGGSVEVYDGVQHVRLLR